ncbi:nitric oxide reductase activation protein [Aestuariirhabdus sp. Z084]|uniref:nitric oxide reductase activation protein NorD n=1 Tax=Aestuariirhabdus haliotis TaxID=2918751 RepID=UPI00201B4165|nr:nitric oxide reductase activation protein [Aestuariirhabdus haliotis]MCL6416589.1 nitric oxide reductase activation protein [Aestuariirhabdus haliotis]MCL6420544.1 nitric oxide reductase activation protein [Aestuariirhabdus haliotis]
MEEFIGGVWHKMISRQASSDYVDARVDMASLNMELATWFRALGGDPGKGVEGADPRVLNIRRGLTQRMAGSHRRFMVSWQDDRSLRLPSSLSCFPDPSLNTSLFFWLTALAAQMPRVKHWFADNQRATRELLERRPGLVKQYKQLVIATIATRPDLETLIGPEREREICIQQALLNPGTVANMTEAKGDPLPVPLWIYPAPLRGVEVASEDDLEDMGDGSRAEENLSGDRKQAQRIDDAKKTDGLLVFKLECLFSWAEQVELDRCQEENLDEDLASAADDLDIISLSRQRRAGAARIKFDLDLPAPQEDDLPLGEGIKLPEWDYRKQSLIEDYCLLQPMLADDVMPEPIPPHLLSQARNLKNRFAQLRPQRSWQRRQPFGDEIDMDSWLELKTQPQKTADQENFYLNRNNPQRELSCLLLSDLSMSTDAALNQDQRVIDVIRDTMVLFAEALSGTGDPFAIYGFSSVKNKQVRYQLLKNFSEPYSDEARGRLLAVKPGFYTRMGAAIRQSSEILKTQKSQQRLLLILSDGKPNDIDRYEGRYGIEDTRRAILEAKQQGLQPFCVTIDAQGNDYLPYLFGDQGFAIVNDVDRLPLLLPQLYLNLTGASA